MKTVSQRKKVQSLCFLVCALSFIVLRWVAVTQKNTVSHQTHVKPDVPAPVLITQQNPWLHVQPKVQGGALEIVRDIERVRALCKNLNGISEGELTALLMNKLLPLQGSIPFAFPDQLYNVLCICGTESERVAPFKILKRLYLGETELGLPFYLDVRAFELSALSVDEIISAHLNILDGRFEELNVSKDRKAYLCRGKRSSQVEDPTHGFAQNASERALFLDFIEKDGHLYVCYAESTLKTFFQHASVFQYLVNQ